MRARLEGTGLRVGGRGSSGQQIKQQVALSEERLGDRVEGQPSKKRGEGYHNITVPLINKFFLITCFWDIASLISKLKLIDN